MIKDNHENEITETETNEATQPAPVDIPKEKKGDVTLKDNTFKIEVIDYDMLDLDLKEKLESTHKYEYELRTKSEVIAPIKDVIKQYEELIDIIPSAKDAIRFFNMLIDMIEKWEGPEYANLYFHDFIDEEKMKRMRLENMLPTLQSKLPLFHTMPIQKLASELQHDIINTGAIDLIVANKGKKNEITSYVLATYEQPEAITMTGKPYTEFDRQVHDAVSSLWKYGHESHVVTPDMVSRAMTNKTQTEKVSPQFKEAVTKSLEKMWTIRIEIDASKEIKNRKVIQDGEPLKRYIYSGNLLSLEKLEVEAGGKTVKAYHILREPVLLEYATMTNQLATVPAELLDIKEVGQKGNITAVSLKSSEARVAVNGYLLRRITVMKNDRTKKTHKQSNIILFDTLFEEAGIPKDKNSANTKKYAFQVLDYFTAMGYIKGYTKRKNKGKGGGIDAVIINL